MSLVWLLQGVLGGMVLICSEVQRGIVVPLAMIISLSSAEDLAEGVELPGHLILKGGPPSKKAKLIRRGREGLDALLHKLLHGLSLRAP